MSDSSEELYRFEVDGTLLAGAGQRLDKYLTEQIEALSRARIQALIKQDCVRVDGSVCSSASFKVQGGMRIVCRVPEPVQAEPMAQNIPLDVVYEDDDVIVINKPAGLVVHPGAGHHDGTLVNALLHHCGQSLSGIGGVLRPGIVHRLDKDTSGLMIAAKNNAAHHGLSDQLKDRSLKRTYQAIVFGSPMPLKGDIDFPIGRHSKNRLKMSVDRRNGREAKTYYHALKDFKGLFSHVQCQLDSGRTHQIRVHMEYRKWPILGDPLYGPQANGVESALKKADIDEPGIAYILGLGRQMLHAQAIEFIHPLQNTRLQFEKSPPEDFCKVLKLFGFL